MFLKLLSLSKPLRNVKIVAPFPSEQQTHWWRWGHAAKLSLVKMKGHNWASYWEEKNKNKKGKTRDQGVELPHFIELQRCCLHAGLPAEGRWCTLELLSPEEWETSRQPGEEAQPQLDQTVQLHLPHPRGWGGGQRGAPERGCCPKRPWSPLLHPSLFRGGCALFPRRDGHNLAYEATSSQVFCTSHRADGNVGEKHMVGLSHRQRYSVGSWCKGREHLGKNRAKPCSHNHQGSSEMAP